MQNPTLLPPPAPSGPQVRVVGVPESPLAIYRGFVAQRRELDQQLARLQDTRVGLSRQLQDPTTTGTDRKGLEQRIADIDARITALDKQIAAADEKVAQSASVPGAVVEERHEHGPPEEVYVLSGIFMVVVLLPLSVALARRIWRRGTATMTALPNELMDRLARLDHAVDSIAVEVERIGEGQRFVTRLFSERAAPDPRAMSEERRASAEP